MMQRERMEYCLEQVRAYQASGQRASAWAQGHGIEPRELASWCAHARRWRAILEGEPVPQVSHRRKAPGFVGAGLPAPEAARSVRLELQAGASRLELHWPLSGMAELALLLREVAR